MTSSGSRRFLVLVDPLQPKDARVRYAFALLHQQPDMRASELASAVNLSTSRLQHLFKTQAGVSIDDYSMDLRLQRAEELVPRELNPKHRGFDTMLGAAYIEILRTAPLTGLH